MKQKYEKPTIEVIDMNLDENIAASAGKDETYDIRIRRNGEEVIVEQGDFETLPGLLSWLREKFGF